MTPYSNRRQANLRSDAADRRIKEVAAHYAATIRTLEASALAPKTIRKEQR